MENIPRILKKPKYHNINLYMNLGEVSSFFKWFRFHIPWEQANKGNKVLEEINPQVNQENQHIDTQKGPVVKALNATNEEKKTQLKKSLKAYGYNIGLNKS